MNNSAEEGGVIFYNDFWPVLENITEVNNTALYGNFIGSYPEKLVVSLE